MTEHQAEASLTLTPEGRIRVLENRIKELEDMLDQVEHFPTGLDRCRRAGMDQYPAG